jgi:hypothetical protein
MPKCKKEEEDKFDYSVPGLYQTRKIVEIIACLPSNPLEVIKDKQPRLDRWSKAVKGSMLDRPGRRLQQAAIAIGIRIGTKRDLRGSAYGRLLLCEESRCIRCFPHLDRHRD